jgi:hypothetical protein
MKTPAGFSAIVLLALVGLVTVVGAQKTSDDFDKTADFSKFRTCASRQGTPAGEVFLDKRIVAAFAARISELPVGALVIDLADAARRELVWRGIGVKEINIDAKPEKRDAAIGRAVEKTLTNYPPRARG